MFRHLRSAAVVTLVLASFGVLANSTPASADTSFANATSIALGTDNPDATAPVDASPYPSAIAVSGLSGTVDDLSVTLSDVSYPYSQDISALLVGPGGQSLVLVSGVGPNSGGSAPATDATLTVSDSGTLPTDSTAWGSAPTFKPFNDNEFSASPEFPSPAPASPGDPGVAGTGATLSSTFDGTSPNGTWNLYVIIAETGDGTGAMAGGWSLDIGTASSAAATTTTLTSSQNPSFTSAPDNSTTLTATVSSGGSPVTSGDVDFTDGGTTIAGCGSVAVNGSGQATCPTSFTSEGTFSLVAEYGGDADYGASTATVSQEADDHTTVSGDNYCNTGSITLNDPPATVADATPYPSHVYVTGDSGTLTHVAVTLENATYSHAQDIDALLVGPGGQSLVVAADIGPSTGTVNVDNVTLTLDDDATSTVSQSVPWGAAGATIVSKPVNYGGDNQTFGPPAPAGSYGNPGPVAGGTATLGSEFNGTAADGTWSLYAITTASGDGTGAIAGGWCLSLATGSAAATTTTLTSSQNPSFTAAPDNSTTLTATVSSGGSPVTAGDVAFSDDGTVISGCGSQAVDGSGQASCTTSFTSEGVFTLTAAYAGDGTDGPSDGTVSQEVDDHTTVSGGNYCNAGSIALNNPTSGAADATPYPSHVYVSGATANLAHVSATLSDVTYPFSQDIDALLVGPGGQSLLLVANLGSTSDAASGSTVTFDDSGALPTQTTAWGSSSTFKPVDFGGPNETFGPPAPATYGDPGTAGTGATLGSEFDGTSANGTWSLYVITTGDGDGTGAIAGGWCLSLSGPQPPAVAVSFGASSVPVGGSTSLALTITNPNATTPLTGVGVTDTLPAGLVVATPDGLTGSCGGGTITAVAGSGSVALSGDTLTGAADCTFSVDVTGVTAGVQDDTTAATSTEGGTGSAASASLTVVGPASLVASFASPTVPLDGTTSLGFTITNPNATTSLTGMGFTDTLPAGLVVATPDGLTGSCGGGTITATAGSATVALAAGTVTSGGSCTFSVSVTGVTAGVQDDTTSGVTSNEGGTGGPASASLTVVGPASLATSFTPSGIALGGTSSLGFTITNPNAATPLTGVGFTDTLPAGLVVATPDGLTGSCGGGTITATAGSGSVALAAGTVATGTSCSFAVDIVGVTAGVHDDTTSAVTSDEGGIGTAASASLTVAAPPTIVVSFGASSVPAGGSTSLAFTITNPNATTPLTGVGVTDTLPAGLVVATPAGLTGSCGGGTITATAGSGSLALSAGTVAAGTSCSFAVDVTGIASGLQDDTTSAVTSNEGGAGSPATASLTVGTPPTVALSFTPSSIPLGGTSSLTFTVTNQAASTLALTGVGVTDTLPAGLVVATPNGLTGTCGAGAITATAGSTTVVLSGGTLAVGGSCTFSVDVTGTSAGAKDDTTSAVTSNEGGTGNTADAAVTVAKATPSLATTASAGVALGGAISDTATLGGGSAPTGTVTFTVFGPGDPACTGTPVDTSTAAVNGDGAYHSAEVVPTTTGVYQLVASYGGDADNDPATGACGQPGESVVVSPVASGPPTGLTATTGPGSANIVLTWSVPTSDGGASISSYEVLRATSSGGEGTVPIATVTGTTYDDRAVVPGTTYFYVVAAVNVAGTSVVSGEASAQVGSASSGGRGMAATPDGKGYWLVAADGGVFSYGDATFEGSAGGTHLNQPVVGMAATPDGKGYWLVAADGGVFSYGDATFEGSAGGTHLNQPVVGMAATPDGKGYWLVAADGGVFSYGDATFEGSAGGTHLNQPVVGMAATPDGKGYWLVAADGGVFSYGDATFEGSAGGTHLNQPVVGMAATPDGKGYWLVAADGGVFSYGDATFEGSAGGTHLNQPVVGIISTPDGHGYTIVEASGVASRYGTA